MFLGRGRSGRRCDRGVDAARTRSKAFAAASVATAAALLAVASQLAVVSAAPRPVALMHGLDASKEAMSHMQAWIEADFPGIHVLNVEVGDGKMSSWFMPIDKQVEALADAVKSDPALSGGFDLIGHSQGGMLARAYVERFNDPPVRHLVTLSSPHSGVFGVPDLNAICPDRDCPWLDDLFSALLEGKAGSLQDHVSFAAYWHDPLNHSAWLGSNKFLTDINNLRESKNSTYKANLASLESWVQLWSSRDMVVVPKTSPKFDFFADGSDKALVSMQETQGYVEDWIGLRTLDTSGRILQRECNCSHGDEPRETCEWVYRDFIKPLLGSSSGGGGAGGGANSVQGG